MRIGYQFWELEKMPARLKIQVFASLRVTFCDVTHKMHGDIRRWNPKRQRNRANIGTGFKHGNEGHNWELVISFERLSHLWLKGFPCDAPTLIAEKIGDGRYEEKIRFVFSHIWEIFTHCGRFGFFYDANDTRDFVFIRVRYRDNFIHLISFGLCWRLRDCHGDP